MADSRQRSAGLLSVDVTIVTAFWMFVQRRDPNECWPWQGYCDEEDDYGRFFFEGRMRQANELALTFTTGERRPDGLDTCHSCDNPPCCNPGHLRFDTRKSNVDDMMNRGRHKPNALLIPEQVVTIRERLASGVKGNILAVQYGVSDATITMIRHGDRWPNVGGPILPRRDKVGRPPRMEKF